MVVLALKASKTNQIEQESEAREHTVMTVMKLSFGKSNKGPQNFEPFGAADLLPSP